MLALLNRRKRYKTRCKMTLKQHPNERYCDEMFASLWNTWFML